MKGQPWSQQGCCHMQPDTFCRCSLQIKSYRRPAGTACTLSPFNVLFFFVFCLLIGRMEVEERTLSTVDVGLSVGDMEAVEALMSMMKHSNTQSFRVKHPRPLTPSSDCSEDESAATGAVAMQESPLVSAPFLRLCCSLSDCLNVCIHQSRQRLLVCNFSV